MRTRMLGSTVPVFPLTPDKMTKVAAAFKALGYRSYANYLAKAKETHISMYGTWGPELSLEARLTTRSMTRGIGPVTQRMPLDIEKIIALQKTDPLGPNPVVEDGPCGAHNLAVIGVFFMLREAEASMLLYGNVMIDTHGQMVTLKLPSSKTDPAAAAVDRSWGCVCATHQKEGCPYHTAINQKENLLRIQRPLEP